MTLRPLFEANLDKAVWEHLSMNSNAIQLLEANPEKINWTWLSKNPNAIHLLEDFPERINWYYLSGNPGAGHLLQANIDKLFWSTLLENTCTEAIQILEKYPTLFGQLKQEKNQDMQDTQDVIDISKAKWYEWGDISADPRAILSLEQNPDRIRWNEDYQEPIDKYYEAWDDAKEGWETDWKTVWLNPAIFDVYESPVLK